MEENILKERNKVLNTVEAKIESKDKNTVGKSRFSNVRNSLHLKSLKNRFKKSRSTDNDSFSTLGDSETKSFKPTSIDLIKERRSLKRNRLARMRKAHHDESIASLSNGKLTRQHSHSKSFHEL